MSNPWKEHWKTIKRVFRYLCGTTDYANYYQGRPGPNKVIDVHGFVDTDWVGDLNQIISTSGYVFNLFGGAICWMIKKHDVVALSTTKVE